MLYRRVRVTSLAISKTLYAFLALLTISAVSGRALAQPPCAVTLSDALGPKNIQTLRSRIETAERRFRPAANIVPEELAYTVSENLPLLRRADLLNPVRPRPRAYVDAYYGKDLVPSPDTYILPLDERTLCLLQPGRAVFLSDGATHHYALVHSIDYKRRIVSLLDPWASTSFLLPGNNLIGASAQHRVGAKKQPLLDLSFDDFLRALHGSVEGFLPELSFAGMEQLYPEIATKEDYLFWKYSRLLATDSFQVSFIHVLEITNRPDLSEMPKLRLLSQWANDYIIGVISGFSVPRPGYAAKKEEIPRLKDEFIARLSQYAQVLPWTLKWLLLQRTKETEDASIRLAILNSFLSVDPSDVDFQISRAEVLLRQGRPQEAISQLESAARQWRSDVLLAIKQNSPAEAEAFLFAKDYSLQSLAVLHWRNMRIELLRRISDLQQNQHSQIGHDATMHGLQKHYVIGSLLIDFFPEVMLAASLGNEFASQDVYIQAVTRLPSDHDRLQHFGLSLYRLFSSQQSVNSLSTTTLTSLRGSDVGRELCRIQEVGRFIPAMKREFMDELKAFCARK